MSALFDAASSQVLLSSTSFVAAAPLTMACWVYPTTTGTNRTVLSFDSSGASRGFRIYQTSGNVWAFRSQTSIIAGSEATTGTVTANGWYFIIGREISATNRRIAVLAPDGSISHAQQTTSRAPSTVNQGSIGADRQGTSGATQNYFTGAIAEVWWTATDIQADGAQMFDSTVRHLARNGPFALPHIQKDIIEYHSFRSALGTDQYQPGEKYFGAGKTMPTWVNTNAAGRWVHPPLAPGYVRPRAGAPVTAIF